MGSCVERTTVFRKANEKVPQVVVTDSAGKLSFRVDCEDTDRSPVAGPNGVGAIVPAPGSSPHPDWFNWYTRAGKVRTLELSRNTDIIAWIPGTMRSLCSTSLGFDHRYQMIDWDKGEKVWDIPCPGGGMPLAVGYTPKLVILAVAELYKGGPVGMESWILENGRTEFVRAFYAVNAADGSIAGRWQAKYPSRWPGRSRERFLRLGENLYYVQADQVIELREDDILLGKSGWQRSAAAK